MANELQETFMGTIKPSRLSRRDSGIDQALGGSQPDVNVQGLCPDHE